MNPTFLALYLVNWLSSKFSILFPSTIILPLVTMSKPPERFKSVDFPALDGLK